MSISFFTYTYIYISFYIYKYIYFFLYTYIYIYYWLFMYLIIDYLCIHVLFHVFIILFIHLLIHLFVLFSFIPNWFETITSNQLINSTCDSTSLAWNPPHGCRNGSSGSIRLVAHAAAVFQILDSRFQIPDSGL